MKTYTFVAWCNYGKGDSGESWIEVELTDEESAKLLHYGTQADIYYKGFSTCKELEDLYKKIYIIAVEQMTEEIREFGDLDEKCAEDPDWKVDDTYPCGVNFPSEFEDLLSEDE